MPAQKNLIPRHPAHERGAHLFMHCHLHRERAEAEQNTSDAPRRPGDARSASNAGNLWRDHMFPKWYRELRQR
jgi:hypothetical protein